MLNNGGAIGKIEPGVFTSQVQCRGRTSYKIDGDHTILQIRGDLSIDAKSIPGIPRFLAGKAGPAIEKFVVNLIKPNLVSVASGLESYLRNSNS